jgi:arylsulfatase B
MGYGDMSCTGTTRIRTPHLDGLAASGVLCTQAYVASPVCSPSRAGLITGRDPRRFGYEGNLNMSAASYATRPELLGLPPGEHTLADHLKAAGYRTGIVGKWHLGTGAGFHPNERGFDHFCGMLGGGHNYFPTAEKNQLERNGQQLAEFSSSYLTDFFTDEAIRFMSTSKKSEPFFLFLSYNAPHTPMQATEDDLALYDHIKDKKRRTYAAMMHGLDRGVGRVLDWLTESNKLINLLHRPAQLFRPATDPGERNDRAGTDRETLEAMFQRLGEWEATLPTVPLWGSSPHWSGDSARIYDTWDPRPEPE